MSLQQTLRVAQNVSVLIKNAEAEESEGRLKGCYTWDSNSLTGPGFLTPSAVEITTVCIFLNVQFLI